MKIKLCLLILVSICSFSFGQITDSSIVNPGKPASPAAAPGNETPKPSFRDIFALGLGIGQDYGGLGLSLTVYPQKNIGLFGSFGYAFAGTGYNFGAKLRLIPEDRFKRISLFALGMYGYNAVVTVIDESSYNKLFYGPSAGAGIDLRFIRNRGYFSFGVIVPFRDPEVDEYMNYLENSKNVDFGSGLIPFTISIGYKIILY